MRLYFDRTLARWDPQERLVAHLDAELGLEASQKDRIGATLALAKDRMEERRRAWEEEVRRQGRECEDAVAASLTPDQLRRFSERHEQIHSDVERFLWASRGATSAVAAEGPR
jgi:hypothetical protein